MNYGVRIVAGRRYQKSTGQEKGFAAEPDFRLYFNRRKQWVDVYLWDVHPDTFERWGGGRWGYYLAGSERTRRGRFGEIHLVRSRVRADGVAHELVHVLADRMRVRNITWSTYTEERIAVWMDELTRSFWREYRKLEQVRRQAKRYNTKPRISAGHGEGD